MTKENCIRCQKKINYDPYNGDNYCSCWCGRAWCSDHCAKLDNYDLK